MSKARSIAQQSRTALTDNIEGAVVRWAREYAPNAPIGEVYGLAMQLSNIVNTPFWEAFHTGQNAKEIDAA
jgi:hypothetical protein